MTFLHQSARKLVKVLMITALWALLPFLNPSLADAQILNGGFESGVLTPWFNTSGSCQAPGCMLWSVTSGDKHSGTYSAEDIGNLQIRQNFAPVSTSDIQSFSFWLRHPNLGTAPAAVLFYYSDNTSFQSLVFSSSTDWQMFDVRSFLTPGKDLSGFGIYGYQLGNGTADDVTRLDDVLMSTSSVPEPGSLVLLATGLVALIPTMRRKVRK